MYVPLLLLLLHLTPRTTACLTKGYCDGMIDCKTTRPNLNTSTTVGFHLLNDHPELWFNLNRATSILKQYGVGSNDWWDPHMSFLYLCCLTNEEIQDKVLPALSTVAWDPINVTYSKAVCTVAGNSIVLYADDSSQQRLLALVEKFERAIMATGVQVLVPRSKMGGFHVTIGTLYHDANHTNATRATEEINAHIHQWTPKPITIDHFRFMKPFWFKVSAQ
jgi:hypothetical protein